MKASSLFLLTGLLGFAPVYATAPFTYETPAEFSAGGDITQDSREDLTIFDRSTGVIRTLIQQADGNFLSGIKATTGLDTLDDFTVMRFKYGVAQRQAILASAAQNKLMRVDLATGFSEDLPLGNFHTPAAVAGAEYATDGSPILFTEQNNSPAYRLNSSSYNTANYIINPAGLTEVAPLRLGNAVKIPQISSDYLAFIEQTSATENSLRLEGISGQRSTGLPMESRWTYGTFAEAGDTGSFLFFKRDEPKFTIRTAKKSTGTNLILQTHGPHDLGAPIHLLVTVVADGTSWLLAFLNQGATANLYDFDGVNAPVMRQSWDAPDGETFSAATGLGAGNFLLLSGPGGRSTNWFRYDFDGSQHNMTRSGALEPLSSFSTKPNVFFFTQDPFITEKAQIHRLTKAGDWSTNLRRGPVTWQLDALVDRGPTLGLGWPSAANFDFTSHIPLANQYIVSPEGRSPVSIATLSNQTGNAVPQVIFSPTPGTYAAPVSTVTGSGDSAQGETRKSAINVTLSSTSNQKILYRFSPTQPWTEYTGPIPLRETKTIFAYTSAAGTNSPVVAGTWKIGEASPTQPELALPEPIDTNHNGLPDAWEDAFGITDPNDDADGDGATNLEEYLAGTDPRNPDDKPVDELVLEHRLVTLGNGSKGFELIWKSTLGKGVLQYSTDLVDWEPVDLNEIETIGENFRHVVPLESATSSGFFRLKR